MSKYDWERGSIKIPTKAWPKFRTGLLKAWNDHHLGLLAKAKKAHAELSAAIKGTRGKKREEALKAAVVRRFERSTYQQGYKAREDIDPEVREMVVTVKGWGDHAKYTLKGLPKKKDLPLVATSKDATIRMRETTAVFSNKERTVHWSVPENNRAVEHAHEHWFAKALFDALGKVTWTRNSGGKIVGNDEYNRDADYEGGGGNYVTHEFSLEKQKRDEERAKNTTRGFYGNRYNSNYRF